MSRMNHSRHAHRGRPTEQAFPARRFSANSRAVAANAGRSLSPSEIAAWASRHGVAVVAR